ncbi:antitoxin Xre-like helix-turn-helix domain-containing protein [Arenibaculum sp.]|jgi:putative toxin-antitoxin system antitoxin component (TIGR02293 family)|uniref:antitoxin Xre-like helix-turn-helix domain-containing protein n=1 Tax=Arenibaculum sp. TaxID=2865862 RepID=UPI002E14E095|nr:antitoxin Xre/MbcA/ParS toxin-binding domain-containing protein [Arenibaculum sp.]
MSQAGLLDVADVLGIGADEKKPVTPLRMVSILEEGLPVKSLERVSGFVAPSDTSFKHRIVPRATLNRRKLGERLTTEESNRVERVARVWALAVEVWKSAENARAFLWREHPLLDLRRPIDIVMANDFGAKLVEDILGRLKHGTAA